MPSFDVMVIGAGPAGLFCAVTAARAGLKVCVLEKNGSAGRKLLLAGAGRCNLTHAGDRADFLAHYGGRERFVKGALFAFTNRDLIAFFGQRNVALAEDREGRVFPASQKGGDVLQTLLDECRETKTTVLYNRAVTGIRKTADGFEVGNNETLFRSRCVVIAAGGKSYPQTGSTGDGFLLARSLGHSIVEPLPALAPVVIRNHLFACCSGISFENRIARLFRNGREIAQSAGDVLITHQGLSGPAIINQSRHVQPGDVIAVSLAPDTVSSVAVEAGLMQAAADSGRLLVRKHLLRHTVPERVLLKLLELHAVPRDRRVSELDKKSRSRIASDLTGFKFTVKSVAGFSEAMVTRGGALLAEVNPATLESRKVPGLYFAGEVLDVDGDTGGYNLQFAFSSGFAAGKSVAGALADAPLRRGL